MTPQDVPVARLPRPPRAAVEADPTAPPASPDTYSTWECEHMTVAGAAAWQFRCPYGCEMQEVEDQ